MVPAERASSGQLSYSIHEKSVPKATVKKKSFSYRSSSLRPVMRSSFRFRGRSMAAPWPLAGAAQTAAGARLGDQAEEGQDHQGPPRLESTLMDRIERRKVALQGRRPAMPTCHAFCHIHSCSCDLSVLALLCCNVVLILSKRLKIDFFSFGCLNLPQWSEDQMRKRPQSVTDEKDEPGILQEGLSLSTARMASAPPSSVWPRPASCRAARIGRRTGQRGTRSEHSRPDPEMRPKNQTSEFKSFI